MTDPRDVQREVIEHFANVKSSDVIKRTRMPSFTERSEDDPADEPSLPGLFPTIPDPEPVALKAYLACALTGLSPDQKAIVIHLSKMVRAVCLELDIEVYEPRTATDPDEHPDVSAENVFQTDRVRVLTSDVLILLNHYPSLGAGIELGFAHDALLPIVVISQDDQRVSRMVKGIPSLVVEVRYRDVDELYRDLRARLANLKPFFEERKLAFDTQRNIVGRRVMELRTSLGLTHEDVALATGLSPRAIENLEDKPDYESNPSLLHLRQLATTLKTTAAELIAPNFTDMIVTEVMSWIDARKAARFSELTGADRNRLVRRALLRVMDQLEQEDELALRSTHQTSLE